MSTQVEDRRVFLSYNDADVAIARSVGAHLTLAGVEVWFDEWRIKAGDSIPGRLDERPEGFDLSQSAWRSLAAEPLTGVRSFSDSGDARI